MAFLQSLAAEFAITIADADVWLAIGLALLLGLLCWVFGTWVARTVGLLERNAPAGEALGVGLASGLMVVAAWWATIWSGGRSSFTPVAVGFAIAIALALAGRGRRNAASHGRTISAAAAPRRSLVLTALAAAVFVVAVALLYGSTMAPSPRDGVQPVEFLDPAFYAVLGRDLATTGMETNLLASGFADLPGLPIQTWYHWAELWLASAVITVFGTAPMAARHFIVLPLVLLAAAALTGTIVRRMARTSSRWAFVFGFLACLFLAPMPVLPGPFFSSWAVGTIFGVALYGLAAVAVLLAVYGLLVLHTRRPTWAIAVFAGSATGFILPAHVVVALLGVFGIGSVWARRVARSVKATGRLPAVPTVWRRVIIASVIALLATVEWASVTGHGLGGSGISTTIAPFNASWGGSVAIVGLGAGLILSIPVAGYLRRADAPIEADLCIGTLMLLIIGAITWGLRLGDFNMFHMFFAGIAVFATPVAAGAAWTLLEYLRRNLHPKLAMGLVILSAVQLELGAATAILRLHDFRPRPDEAPIPIEMLQSIARLPSDARLAYACPPWDEVAFTVPRLLSIDAHTGRRVVPMCFEADYFHTLIGGEPSLEVASPSFRWAPQRALYPTAWTVPSSAEVTAFLRSHGINYIYADSRHANSLVADAVTIARSGEAVVLRLP